MIYCALKVALSVLKAHINLVMLYYEGHHHKSPLKVHKIWLPWFCIEKQIYEIFKSGMDKMENLVLPFHFSVAVHILTT